MPDVSQGTVILSRNGDVGRATGGGYPCRMDSCCGARVGVRWPDGELTFPCTKDMFIYYNDNEPVLKLR
jgi:hypothetical protein